MPALAIAGAVALAQAPHRRAQVAQQLLPPQAGKTEIAVEEALEPGRRYAQVLGIQGEAGDVPELPCAAPVRPGIDRDGQL